MAYAVLWIENLAVSLLLMALLLACVGRMRRRWLRHALWMPAALILLLAYATQTIFTAVMQFKEVTFFVFWPTLALTLSFLAGVILLAISGLRRLDTGIVPTVAGGWPRMRLAVVLSVAVAMHLMTFWNLELAIQQQMAWARAEAGVLALSVAPPRVQPRDNAAIVYEQAFADLSTRVDLWKISHQNLEYAGNSGWEFDAKDPALRPILRSYAPAIALLNQAATKPGCYFEFDYYWPSIFAMPYYDHLPQVRQAGYLLVLDASTKAADGDGPAAAKEINAMLTLAQHLGAETITVSVLASMSIENRALGALQYALTNKAISPVDLSILQLDDATSYQRLFPRVIRLEEAHRLASFCDMGSDKWWGPRIAAPLEHVWRVLLLADALTGHTRVSQHLRDLAAKPYYETRTQWKNFRDQLDPADTGYLARTWVSSFDIVAEAVARADALRQAAQLALAAEQYRARHGRFPEKLDELAPAFIPLVPRDPFDGKPMRMKRTKHSIIVYSIGPDMVDNDGSPLDQTAQKGDITFTLPDGKP